MLFLLYSTALSLSKPPYVTYTISLLCLLIFYAQFNNNIEINNSLHSYCQSIQVNNYDEASYDLLTQNISGCAQILGLLHQRSGHASDSSLIKLVNGDKAKYLTIDVINKIDTNLERHLSDFQALAPSSLDGVLMHFPDEINPIPMLTSTIAHASWSHVIFNLIFLSLLYLLLKYLLVTDSNI